jgi:hypothetical protein
MSVLRGPDGRFYDVPDDQLAAYAVPPEKVRETLEKAGVPAPAGQAGPGGGGGPPGMGMQGGPVVIQIYPPPGGGPGPGPGPAGGPGQEGAPGGQGQVDPYWWYYWTRYWPRYYWHYYW